MRYNAPVKDMVFVLKELAGLEQVSQLPGCEDATEETAIAVLTENAKFTSEVLAPLNWSGDVEAANWKNGVVSTANGFKEAFKAFTSQGWLGLQHPAEFGGQGLPKLIALAWKWSTQRTSALHFAPCSPMVQLKPCWLLAASNKKKHTFLK